MFRKIFAYILILLFIGASFVTFSGGDLVNKNDKIGINESASSSTINWWSMFRHDLDHSGNSASSTLIAGARVNIGYRNKIMYFFGEQNNPPDKQNIYGPDNGTINVNYTFCIDTITNPNGNFIFCFWDWDDGSNSGWLGPYASGQTICASHKWTEPGVYCILVKLKDENGTESEWSDPFCITIVENQPPSAPSIDGPKHVQVGVENSWSFISIDFERENITYYVDWGDKCGGAEYYGPYLSGQIINLSHRYTKKNALMINALAIDNIGAESNLSYFEVEISRNKAIINNRLFQELFLQFIQAFTIIKQIIKK